MILYPDCDFFSELRDDDYSPYPDGCESCYRYETCKAAYTSKNILLEMNAGR